MTRSVTAFAPASVSNVACGFDIMGFALEQPGDHVTVRFAEDPGVRISVEGADAQSISLDPRENTAGMPVMAMVQDHAPGQGIEIIVRKGLPVGSGIGSSAASAVAASLACDALLGCKLQREEILRYAIEGERIASGAVHVDNLAPALWGGFVLVRGYDPIDLVHLPVPDELWCSIVCPDVQIRTREAREMLPKCIPLSDVVRQTGNAAGLVVGLMSGNLELIGRSLHDVIAEPARSCLIPGFLQLKKSAMEAGALGCSISGSGPAMFALAGSRATAKAVEEAMAKAVDGKTPLSLSFVSPVAKRGARIIE
jgi:homoserine kinase